MRTASTFSILFWVYTKRAKNNQAKIYVRVTLNGKRVNISLKRKVDINAWDSKRQRAKGNGKDARSINLYLSEVQSKIFQIYSGLKSEEKSVTSETIKSIFLGESSKLPSFKDLVNYHNDKLKHKLHPNTIRQYKTSQRYMMEYIKKEYGASDIKLKDMKYEFVIGFENFLRSYQPSSGHPKIGNNTAMKHIKRLRKMVTLAYRMEWINRDPFLNFKTKIEKKERGHLTSSELESIENLKSSIERLVVVRDLFIFSCYTGISYGDIAKLTKKNLVIGVDGNPWLMANRIKTGTPFKIPVLPKAQTLIHKYTKHFRTDGKTNLMPDLSNQKLNSCLKEIADLCNIKKNLTFHMARHTFATTVTLSNGVPLETVSKLLGHTKLATTQIYAKVIEQKVCADMEDLRIKLEPGKTSSAENTQPNLRIIR